MENFEISRLVYLILALALIFPTFLYMMRSQNSNTILKQVVLWLIIAVGIGLAVKFFELQ